MNESEKERARIEHEIRLIIDRMNGEDNRPVRKWPWWKSINLDALVATLIGGGVGLMIIIFLSLVMK